MEVYVVKSNTIDEIILKKIIKEAVRDVLDEEIIKLQLLFAPYISEKEQKEIEKKYKKPSTEVARTITLKE